MTSVTAGYGLAGGTITSSGTLSLATDAPLDPYRNRVVNGDFVVDQRDTASSAATVALIEQIAQARGVPVTLKDMGLVPFLQSVDRKSLGTPKFDTNTMGCPFEVKVTLLQPHAPNTVRELVRSEPSRKDFLQWISTLRFKYPEGFERYLVGDTTTVTVPCMALDLT
mgnify:CR=1 FL=1